MQVEIYAKGFCSARKRASAVFYDRDVTENDARIRGDKDRLRIDGQNVECWIT